jgi:hypothetical protein
MALVLFDRVKETSNTSGTGTIVLLGAQTGYQSFAVVGNNNTTYYTVADQTGANWEVGVGTYYSGNVSLSRDTILASSNANAAVSFTNATHDVFITYPAEKSVNQDATGNVSSYKILGGTIDNTVIGATTPAAGTFTTITGQTVNLTGTGQNLLLQSNAFTTSPWGSGGVTLTSGQTDPFGGSTAWQANITANGNFYQPFTSVTGQTYTWSVYLKAGTFPTSTQLICFATNTIFSAFFNLSTGTVTSTTGTGTAAITSVGGGWYRCSATAVATLSGTGYWEISYTTGATGTFNLYGAQVNTGTLGVYTPTTITSVFGYPSLSFNGTIGVQMDVSGNLSLSPAGTGALQAQATTSSATGGNARGANAVDWQTLRDTAAKVASGAYSIVGGGQRNVASGSYSQALGGYNNTSSGFESVLVGGQTNQATGQISFIGGGTANTASGYGSNVVGGTTNTSAGVYNFIGGGQLNSGTSGSIVTTQSATMNGTTAVTLSGSNAAIKVGQYISGTSIATDTYVAAISGTSLTLSIAASGSSTSTLSFFTPHGVVVGGGNNQATGAYSFIGGGGDAGTAANRNVASGDWSVVGGGRNNTASGVGSVVSGGGLNPTPSAVVGNTSSGVSSFVGAGQSNQASGNNSFIGAGLGNTANSVQSVITGGAYGTSRLIVGLNVFSASNNPMATSSVGTQQSALLILAKQTTDATATVLTSDSSAASGTNQVILPNNSAYYVRGSIVAGVTGGGDSSSWTFQGTIKRGANAAATSLVAAITATLVSQDTGAALWGGVTITADTTNGGLAVTVTGKASTTIRWVCKVETTEMSF